MDIAKPNSPISLTTISLNPEINSKPVIICASINMFIIPVTRR